MNSDRIKMLEGILKSGISPILLEDFPVSVFQDAVITMDLIISLKSLFRLSLLMR